MKAQMKSKKVDAFIRQVLENSGLKEKDIIKHSIVWKSFFKEIEPFTKNMSTNELCGLASKFLLFVIQYETICIKAFAPLSGSLSVADDIIRMYSSREIDQSQKPIKNKQLN